MYIYTSVGARFEALTGQKLFSDVSWISSINTANFQDDISIRTKLFPYRSFAIPVSFHHMRPRNLDIDSA
jgi:hypothetical protein